MHLFQIPRDLKTFFAILAGTRSHACQLEAWDRKSKLCAQHSRRGTKVTFIETVITTVPTETECLETNSS